MADGRMDAQTHDMELAHTAAAVIRAVTPELVDSKARVKALEMLADETRTQLDEIAQWAAGVTDFVNRQIQAGVLDREAIIDPPGVDELMATLHEYGVTVGEYAKFLRGVKTDDKGENDEQ